MNGHMGVNSFITIFAIVFVHKPIDGRQFTTKYQGRQDPWYHAEHALCFCL
ncbi:hypothetical protein ABOZ80_19325 [Bacillus stercoris]|uniref:hypothetical protein n=1 Tax=Bacillus stercoris TaxID=2054641 RepID=UPI003AB8E7DE